MLALKSDNSYLIICVTLTLLFCPQVLHKAILKVDEKGTEAAGTTTIEINQRAMSLPIKMNRPFLVFIVEKAVKNILFMGKIINPTE